jgi:hypothetical protein
MRRVTSGQGERARHAPPPPLEGGGREIGARVDGFGNGAGPLCYFSLVFFLRNLMASLSIKYVLRVTSAAVRPVVLSGGKAFFQALPEG